MEKGDVALAVQLFNSMLEGVNKLEEAQKQRNFEEFQDAKKTILMLQKELDKIM